MKIGPMHMKRIKDMYTHFFQQRCECGGKYKMVSQDCIREDTGLFDVRVPRKLKESEVFFIDLFKGKCKKCAKEKEFYYSIIQKNLLKMVKDRKSQ